jgi:hypothetical protein
LSSALDVGEWSVSHPFHFTPRERTPATPWIRGWLGLRAVLDAVLERKTPMGIISPPFKLGFEVKGLGYQNFGWPGCLHLQGEEMKTVQME